MDENDYGSRDQKGHYIPNELNIKKSEMVSFRNQSIIGLLLTFNNDLGASSVRGDKREP